MIKRFAIIFTFSMILIGIFETGQAAVKPLLVGVTPINPPVIFKMDGKVVGLEADFARRLSAELKRPVELVEVSWEKQIPALLEKKTDIIMSGMTITPARQVRIAFTQPYLTSGLMIAFTTENAPQYSSLKNLMEYIPSVGFIGGTTGEVYARNTFRNENRMVPIKSVKEAALELKNKSIDIFVYDAPAIMWMVSENEAELKFLQEPLTIDYLGWGLRQEDRELLGLVNGMLNKWKNDGSLKQMILKWLPYWKHF
jgi:ABC-type amino acid transport substrate-binding protein